jgi:hypothetical protein
MEENKLHPTSIRLTPERIAKLDRVATNRNVSRNELVSMMVDGLEETEVPPVRVKLPAAKKEKVLA